MDPGPTPARSEHRCFGTALLVPCDSHPREHRSPDEDLERSRCLSLGIITGGMSSLGVSDGRCCHWSRGQRLPVEEWTSPAAPATRCWSLAFANHSNGQICGEKGGEIWGHGMSLSSHDELNPGLRRWVTKNKIGEPRECVESRYRRGVRL